MLMLKQNVKVKASSLRVILMDLLISNGCVLWLNTSLSKTINYYNFFIRKSIKFNGIAVVGGRGNACFCDIHRYRHCRV